MVPERLAPLVEATSELAERFRSAGHRLYLVGGSVRDAIAPLPGDGSAGSESDLDFTTDARPEEIRALLQGWADSVWLQGERFGTIGARAHGRQLEITTDRKSVV